MAQAPKTFLSFHEAESLGLQRVWKSDLGEWVIHYDGRVWFEDSMHWGYRLFYRDTNIQADTTYTMNGRTYVTNDTENPPVDERQKLKELIAYYYHRN